MTQESASLLALTAKVVGGYVRDNPVAVDQLPELMGEVHSVLSRLQTGAVAPVKAEPIVPVNRSVKQNAITCLECGRAMKTLKKHLNSEHGLSPEAYREKYELQRDYPMVSRAYAEQRSELAKKIGLGRKPAARRGRRKSAG